MSFKNYYEVLGISSTATQDEIKKRYRFLAKRWHSDPNRVNEESENREYAEEKLKEINQAHDVLKDPIKRAAYDRDLRLKAEQERRAAEEQEQRRAEEQRRGEENEQTPPEPIDAEWERREESYREEPSGPPPRTPIEWIHRYSASAVAERLKSFKLKSGSNLDWFRRHYTDVISAHLARIEYYRPERNPLQWFVRSAAESAVLLVGFCLIALLLIAVLSSVFGFLSSLSTSEEFGLYFILFVNLLVILGLLARRLVHVTRKKKPFFRRSLIEYALLSFFAVGFYVVASIASLIVMGTIFRASDSAPNQINPVAVYFFINLIGLYAFRAGYRVMSPQRRKITLSRLIAGFGVIATLLVMGFLVATLFYSAQDVERDDNANTSTQSLPVNPNYQGNSNYSNSNHSSISSRLSDKPTFEELNPTVTYVKFFEAGKAPSSGDRQYATIFSQNGTRFVHWELSLSHPAPDKKINFTMNVVWHLNGKVEFSQKVKTHIEEGWNGSIVRNGYGCDSGACWKPGVYQVDLFVDGKKITDGSFEILNSPSPNLAPTDGTAPLHVNSIDGTWIIYWGQDGKYEAILEIIGGRGTFTAPMSYTVYQRLTFDGEKGAHSPDTPVIKDTRVPVPGFIPDYLRFIDGEDERQPTAIETMDGKNIRAWTAVYQDKIVYSPDRRFADLNLTFPDKSVYKLRISFAENGTKIVLAELETQVVQSVKEEVQAQVTSEGIIVSCNKPTLVNGFTAPAYAEDTFRFRPDGKGGFFVDHKNAQYPNWKENIRKGLQK